MKRLLRIALAVSVASMALAVTADSPGAQGQLGTAATPRTPWGDPDLQGTWNTTTATPLQRSKELAAKPFYTKEEALAVTKKAFADADRDVRAPGTSGDVNAAYNEFWSDRGEKLFSNLNLRTSLVIDPPDGRLPPTTPEGQRRIEARRAAMQRPPTTWEDRSLWERCLSRGVPTTGGSYNNNFVIMQVPGYVIIHAEMIHETRIIPLGAGPRLREGTRQWMGDSRGHWDGNSLVVDTTNFNEGQQYQGTSKNLHLVERYTRVDDDSMEYQFTIDDPTVYTRPWTVELPMLRTDEKVYEYACHEANYGMEGMLHGARVEEAKKK